MAIMRMISVPRYDELTEDDTDVDYAYRVDGNELVFYNIRDISAAVNGYFEIMYSTSKNTIYYEDMAASEAFASSMTVKSLSKRK